MEYRTLGKSEVKVSELAFGAWAIGGWMWGGADSKEAIEGIETAIDHGMTTIDTAAVYGFGLSEELTGKAIKGKRSKVQILTKFGLTWNEKKGEFYFASVDNAGDTRPTTIYYKEPNLSRILLLTNNLKEIANERKVTLSQLVLNWTMQQPGISCTLAGARNSAQVLDNAKAAGFRLSKDEVNNINNLLSNLKIETKV